MKVRIPDQSMAKTHHSYYLGATNKSAGVQYTEIPEQETKILKLGLRKTLRPSSFWAEPER